MKRLLGVCLLLVSFGLSAAGGNPLTPESLPGGKVVAVAEVKALQRSGEAIFFDMRNAINYGRGHLPGARPLPYLERSEPVEAFDAAADQFDISALPKDRKQPVVFYSHGDTGWKSYKAAVQAVRAGYVRVHWFRGGVAAWEAAAEKLER